MSGVRCHLPYRASRPNLDPHHGFENHPTTKDAISYVG